MKKLLLLFFLFFSYTTYAQLNLTISGDTILCKGDVTTISLQATNGVSPYFFKLNDSILISNKLIVSPDISTSYTLTVIDSIGNSAMKSINVKVNPLPKADAGKNQSSCNIFKSLILVATGGEFYQWDDNSTNDTITVTPSHTTTYTVSVSSNGCTSSDDIVVTVINTPLSVLDAYVCKGDTAILKANGYMETYLWNTGDTTESITVSPKTQTTYTVTATMNPYGCISIGSGIVYHMQQATVNISTSDSIICSGMNGVVSAISIGFPLIEYRWNTNQTSSIININPLTNSTYTVTITDQNGCTNSDSIKISVIECKDSIISTNVIKYLSDASFVTVLDKDRCIVNFTTPVDSVKITKLSITSANTAIIEWTFWQQGIIKTFSNDITFTNQGWNIIYQTITCSNKMKAQNSITFVDAVNIVLTDNHELYKNYINILPNPATTNISITGFTNTQTIEIFNATGQVFYSSHKALTTSMSEQINISNLEQGIYFVKVQTDKGTEVKKIIKK